MAYLLLLPLAAVILLSLPLYPVYKGMKTGKKAKNAIVFNLCGFAGVMVLATVFPLAGFAADTAAAAAGALSSDGLGYIAAALATGLAALGAGIAVSSGASSAIGAVSEDPKNFAKALIFVALGEGVAVYGLLISILILNKLG